MRGDVQNDGKCALKCRPRVSRKDKERKEGIEEKIKVKMGEIDFEVSSDSPSKGPGQS
jgi:hypothetical protein